MSDARVPRIPAALSAPSLNRGVGFTHAQRRRLGLTGRLPSAVLTLDQQAERVWHQLQSLATDLGRNLLLEQLHYRHEVLYFKVLADHLPELMPVVYTPTVGEAIQRFSDEYRGQRGLFLSIDEPDTAGGGVDPRRCLAVSLDVGTDNEQLLADPFYLGNRHARRRGREYDEFVSRYIETAQRLFPRAILHFEDFGPANARKILDTYGTDYCVFNDDMQGTGAVVLAAVYSGLKVTGIPLRDQTIVVFGAGTAGMGIADQIRDAMVADGATLEQAVSQIWPIDRPGLLFDDMDDLRDFQVPYAKNRHQLGVAVGDRVGLSDAIKIASPTILLGCSTVYGAFTKEVVEAMTASCKHPMIFPLSNPTSRMEAIPADVLAWSNGRALLATGSPVAPVEFDETTYVIGQANNVLAFPGIGLGVIVAGARLITRRMLHAAAKAIAHQANPTNPGDSLLPDVQNLRAISTTVAEAVYRAAVQDGVASRTHDDVRQAIVDTMWLPAYD